MMENEKRFNHESEKKLRVKQTIKEKQKKQKYELRSSNEAKVNSYGRTTKETGGGGTDLIARRDIS